LFIVRGHQHDGVPQAGIIDQTLAEFGSKGGIEVAGRFVSQDKRRLGD